MLVMKDNNVIIKQFTYVVGHTIFLSSQIGLDYAEFYLRSRGQNHPSMANAKNHVTAVLVDPTFGGGKFCLSQKQNCERQSNKL